jgi:RNA polymerase sigma-70 factor (ECF subfamily)
MTGHAARVLDEFLVVSARAGSREALDHLVRRWHRKLVAHAWRLLGDPEAAQDAVQTAWGEIVRGLHRLQDERAFPAWIYRIVSRACARQVGSRARERQLQSALASEPSTGQVAAHNGGDAEALLAAINDLPPAHRAAVALYHFEQLSIAEVAVALEIPAGTVKTRLMHARRKLRVALQGEE